MLAKPNRLRNRQDFAAVYQQGTRRSTAHLTLRARRRAQVLSESAPVAANLSTRIGFSISLKVSKQAVVRNRLKRQLRAGCRQLLPHLSPGWDLVITVRAGSLPCDYHQFLQELKQLLVASEVLNGD